MTATMTAPPVETVAPNLVTRVKDGDLSGAQKALMALGVVLLGVTTYTGLTGDEAAKKHYFFAYLVAYMFTLGICLGGLFFTMLQHIVRAGWSVGVRRIAENVTGVLPWMFVLFLPIVLGFDTLFHHWVHADPADKVIAGKSGYLNPTFFFVRVGIYFAIWIGLGTWFRRASLAQDQSGDPTLSLKMSRMAAPGLLLFALSITFAAFDWIMSLDPHWFSTIFGITYFAGAFMAFLAFTILLAKWLGAKGYLREAITVEHYHDLGKLMFGFMVFWTYTNFSQYMLIWYANLAEETAFYAHRQHGGWDAVGTILIVGHFFVPFAFLMSRHIKRNGFTLSLGALFLLLMHWVDMQYLILPNMGHGEAHAAGGEHSFAHSVSEYLHGITWIDAATLLGVVSLVAGFVIGQVRKHNLVPVRDPRLAESLHFHNI